jgi:hypothetical protein
MTAKCANPCCREPFLYFRSGKIFLIEAPGSHHSRQDGVRKAPEYFWLCGECSRTMRVVLDRMGVATVEMQIASDAVA